MPKASWSKRLAYDSSLHRLVLHGYEVSQGDARLIGRYITERFEWINSVQIDAGFGKRQIVIDLELTREFHEATHSYQHSSIYELMQQIATSVDLDLKRTAIDINGHLALPHQNQERK